MIGMSIDIGAIVETHLKNKHTAGFESIAGYASYRRDREGRRGGGVMVYVKNNFTSTVVNIPIGDKKYELLW